MMTPLFMAATFGNLEITKRLIEAGAQLDAMDETRQTPLHRAAAEGHLVNYMLCYFIRMINIDFFLIRMSKLN